MSLYALPEVPRSESGRRHIKQLLFPIGNLWDSHLDGLIVTGAEPQACNLTGRTILGSLAKVVEWAEHNTHSTVWSCLAAHAALLHIDGIGRRRLARQAIWRVSNVRALRTHPLTAGASPPSHMPHSRWNDILNTN